MTPERLAGLGSVAALVHDLLLWGGLVGCVALVALSTHGRRRAPDRVDRPDLVRLPASTDVGDGAGREPWSREHDARPVTVDSGIDDRLVVVAGCAAAAAGVHAVMVLAHAAAPTEAVFFALVAAVQAWLAARVLLRPDRVQLVGVIVLHVVLLAVWAASRTVGVLGQVEVVEAWDAAVVVWQVVALVVAVRVLRAPAPVRLSAPASPAAWGVGAHAAVWLSGLTLLLLPAAGSH